MSLIVFCIATEEEKQIIIKEKSTPRKETKNSYLQLQGTETWSTTYNDTKQNQWHNNNNFNIVINKNKKLK